MARLLESLYTQYHQNSPKFIASAYYCSFYSYLHLLPYLISTLFQIFDILKWGGAIGFNMIPKCLITPMVISLPALHISRFIGYGKRTYLEFGVAFVGLLIAVSIISYLATILIQLARIMWKSAEYCPRTQNHDKHRKKKCRKAFRSLFVLSTPRPFARNVYRKLFHANKIPIHVFSCKVPPVFGYSIHASHSFIIRQRCGWNNSIILKSIMWTSEMLQIPWSMLRGRANSPPEGAILMVGLTLLSFAIPLTIALARIHIISIRRNWTKLKNIKPISAISLIADLTIKNIFLYITIVTVSIGKMVWLAGYHVFWYIFGRSSILICRIFSRKSRYLHSFALATRAKKEHEIMEVTFDPEGTSVILDNAANVHIWNNKGDFVDYIPAASNSKGVSTIGDIPAQADGVGNVPLSWTDDEGKIYSIVLKNVQHHSKSPVNVLSIGCLADQLDDDEGTSCKTYRLHSNFSWEGDKFHRTLQHPTLTRIPELPVRADHSKFKAFCSNINREMDYNILPTCCVTARTKLPPLPVEGENNDKFKVGDTLTYTREGKIFSVKLLEIIVDKLTFISSFKVEKQDGSIFITPKEFLRHPLDKSISTIPRTESQYRQDMETFLTSGEMAQISKPSKASGLEEEYLKWHERLGHPSVQDFEKLIKIGLLPTKFRAVLKKPPLCISCVFGKMQKRKWRTSKDDFRPIRKDSESFPGARVSTDQIISAQPGLLPRMEGGHTRARIWAATVFKDHFSDIIYTHLMTSPSLEETIEAKQAFEKFADPIDIKSYHADNGQFAKEGFREEVKNSNQTITFCAVGAHHQSGIIERAIGQLTHDARTMLLHAERYWPEMISPLLWPFALKAAEFKHNYLKLDENGKSKMEKFLNITSPIDIKLQHTFGCPVYVLEAAQQSSIGGLPKWEPRCRIGIYLGHSPCHAGSVALILNPRTLYVSPQYHTVFDDDFTTVPYMRNEIEPPHWAELVRNASELVTDEEYSLAQEWTNSTITNEGDIASQNEGASNQNNVPLSPVSEGEVEEEPNKMMPKLTSIDDITLRRSSRIAKNKAKGKKFGLFSMICLATTVLTTSTIAHSNKIFDKSFHAWEKVNQHFDGTLGDFHPLAFTSTTGDNETYTVKTMLQQEDVSDFITAMKKEVEDHERREHWEIVPRSSMPAGLKTIMMVWSFKRKRYPDGRINKHKARLCAHGGMQQWGIDYWETYAPVVNWLSIRTLLAISMIHGLESRSIDFVLAFPQATLEESVYTELPYGFDTHNGNDRRFVIKLKKNLYGLKQAGYNWFEHLSKGLHNRGFNPSHVDPCIFYRENAIIITYVDDCIVLYRDKNVFDELVDSLKNGPEKFDLTDEGDINMYLGVEIQMLGKPDPNMPRSFEMKQPFLIGRILKLLSIVEGDNSKPTPATKPVLTKDSEGDIRNADWNYRQAIGMLSYLTGSTRPDISMAVNQCARFSNDPKLSHERAVKRIVRYLHGTKDRGIIFNPDPKRGLECFVDADFAGGWNILEPGNPDNVLSRTGFVIYYAGCPILWKSKLQTEIALSTTESEYIALSQAMRDVIPMMALLLEINKLIDLHIPKPEIHCKVFEDNNSCIAVAESPKFTPRTKHISIKYHHFRSFVKNKSIIIKHIGTKEQIADIFTKPLDGALFQYLRKKLSGW